MKDHTHNKEPKDSKLCRLIRKTITINRKEIGLEFADVAFELGLQVGTLENKLKPSYANGDLTLTEFMHFLELTGDYEALRYIASKYDFTLVKNIQNRAECKDIHRLVDNLAIEGSEVFRTSKKAMDNGYLSEDENISIVKGLEELITSANEFKNQLEHQLKESKNGNTNF